MPVWKHVTRNDVICHLHSRQLPSDEELRGDVGFLFEQHRMI